MKGARQTGHKRKNDGHSELPLDLRSSLGLISFFLSFVVLTFAAKNEIADNSPDDSLEVLNEGDVTHRLDKKPNSDCSG